MILRVLTPSQEFTAKNICRIASKTSTETITQGIAWLDPALCHALRDYEITAFATKEPDQTVRATGHIEYAEDSREPRPTLIRQESLYWHGQHQRIVFEPTEWSYRPVPLADFSLEHYGLGDFKKPGGGPGVATWAFALAGVLLAGGFFLRRSGRAR